MTQIAASRILLALLLGVIAAAANVLGGLAIVRGQWSRAYLKYFIALGAGFMLATAFLEMIPESLKITAHPDAVFFLVLAGYLLVHFFEHTLAPHSISARRRITTKWLTRTRESPQFSAW